MRRRRPLIALFAPLLVLALLVSACGGGGGSDDESSEGAPSVSGEFGDKPKIKVEKGSKPGKKLTSEVLDEGDGPAVAKGDLLVADYLGQVYGGKVFDNSYDNGAPAAFPIGTGQVIPGWDKELVGTKAGSRVLLVVPPKEGYGTKGNPQAGIKGTDSLVFVVDVIASYAKDAAPEGAATAVDGLSTSLPKVEGKVGAKPKITVPESLTPPKKTGSTVLAEGDGEPIAKGKLAVVNYDAVSWGNKPLSSSWETGPQGVPVGAASQGGQPSPFDELIGVPVGSRVLLTLPAQQGTDAKTQSVAVVVDVLAQHGPAKDAA